MVSSVCILQSYLILLCTSFHNNFSNLLLYLVLIQTARKSILCSTELWLKDSGVSHHAHSFMINAIIITQLQQFSFNIKGLFFVLIIKIVKCSLLDVENSGGIFYRHTLIDLQYKQQCIFYLHLSCPCL